MPEVLDPPPTAPAEPSSPPRPAAQSAAATSPAPAGPPHVQDYDFERPERISKEQIRAFSAIHDAFARNFAAWLSAQMRMIVETRVSVVEQVTYGEFIHGLASPTVFVVLSAPPLEGRLCLDLSPLVIFPVLDRLLGGGAATVEIPARPLTAIEWRLTQRIIARMLEHLAEGWQNVVDLKFEVYATESNPALVQVVAPGEIVALTTLEVKFGQFAGPFKIAIPFNTIEPVVGKLDSQAQLARPRTAVEMHHDQIVHHLSRNRVGLTVFLGSGTVKLSELRALRPGDMIRLDKRVESDLVVQISALNKLAGRPGQSRGRRAVRLTRLARPDEPI